MRSIIRKDGMGYCIFTGITWVISSGVVTSTTLLRNGTIVNFQYTPRIAVSRLIDPGKNRVSHAVIHAGAK